MSHFLFLFPVLQNLVTADWTLGCPKQKLTASQLCYTDLKMFFAFVKYFIVNQCHCWTHGWHLFDYPQLKSAKKFTQAAWWSRELLTPERHLVVKELKNTRNGPKFVKAWCRARQKMKMSIFGSLLVKAKRQSEVCTDVGTAIWYMYLKSLSHIPWKMPTMCYKSEGAVGLLDLPESIACQPTSRTWQNRRVVRRQMKWEHSAVALWGTIKILSSSSRPSLPAVTVMVAKVLKN